MICENCNLEEGVHLGDKQYCGFELSEGTRFKSKEEKIMEFEEEFKIIEAGFNGNDESLLELKVSFGDWTYKGILELDEKGKKEIKEAMKNWVRNLKEEGSK